MKPVSVILLFVFASVLSLYSQDVEGVKDPPLFERLPGFNIYDYTVTDLGGYQFCNEEGDNIIIEGKITYYYYETDGEIDPQKIINKFSSAVLEKGGEVYGDDPNQKYMHYSDTNKLVWVDLFAEDFYYTLNIIEKGQKISDITAEDLLKSLEEDGSAVLYFNFDRDKCEIKEECREVLEMLAGVFTSNPELEVNISGYTDDLGRSDINLEVSQNRAKALADKLIGMGVDSERITWEGFGEENPVADNSTLEGRTLNNRLVLTKK